MSKEPDRSRPERNCRDEERDGGEVGENEGLRASAQVVVRGTGMGKEGRREKKAMAGKGSFAKPLCQQLSRG